MALNKKAVAWGRKMVFAGALDKADNWNMNDNDRDMLLQMSKHDWDEYGKWFLEEDNNFAKNCYDHWKSPIGKAGRLHEEALVMGILSNDAEVSKASADIGRLLQDTAPNFSINNEGEVLFYGVLGWEDTAKELIGMINETSTKQDEVTLRINSPGGSLAEGLALYNYIKSFSKPVNMVVDGVAASAASLVACAGSVTMMEGTALFLHNPQGFAIGDYRDMEKEAEDFKKFRDAVANVYASKSGRSLDEVTKWLDDETYFFADEAHKVGLCDHVVGTSAQMSTKYLTYFNGGTKMNEKLKKILADLKLEATEGNLMAIASAVEGDAQDEIKTLKTTVRALDKTNTMSALSSRIGDTPAVMLGKVHDIVPDENFEAIVELVESLQMTIKDLGGAAGDDNTSPVSVTDEQVEAKISKIVKDEGVERSAALNLLSKREPELIANWR